MMVRKAKFNANAYKTSKYERNPYHSNMNLAIHSPYQRRDLRKKGIVWG